MMAGGAFHSVVRNTLLDLFAIFLESLSDRGFFGQSVDRSSSDSVKKGGLCHGTSNEESSSVISSSVCA